VLRRAVQLSNFITAYFERLRKTGVRIQATAPAFNLCGPINSQYRIYTINKLPGIDKTSPALMTFTFSERYKMLISTVIIPAN
jgi:hypothetical protein